MEKRIYKKPPINEMYMGVHFEAKPSIGTLDFHEFSHRVNSDFIKTDYIFPIIEKIGNLEKILIEPEKVWFLNNDGTKLLQFIKDRMVYNWRTNNKSSEQVIYPKYESIKKDFFKYWELLSTYIRQYKDRKLKIKMQELYYSNVLPVGEDHFLKNSSDLFRAFSIISPYPEGYVNINSQMNLQIPIENNLLFLNLNKIKIEDREEIVFVLMMRSKNEVVENINESWYNDAHLYIKDFFEKITTEDIRNYWKGRDI